MLRVNNLVGFGAGGAASPIAGGGGGDPHWSSVKMLLGFDGSDGATSWNDESDAAHGSGTWNGNAQIDTAQSKFGGGSLLLDANGDYINYADHVDWELGSGPFTIDVWARFNAWDTVSGPNKYFISKYHASLNSRSWYFSIQPQNERLIFLWSANGSGTSFLAGSIGSLSGVTTDTWYHFSADRDANSDMRLYFNGAVHAGPTNVTAAFHNNGSDLRIGAIESSGILAEFDGWMDELRLTPGVGRYGGAFTPPTEMYPRMAA